SCLLGGPPPALVIKFLDRNDTHSTVIAELPHINFVQAASNSNLDGALWIDQSLLNGPAERCTVMEARADIVIAGVAMGIDMHQAERSIPCDRPQNRERDRMVPTDRQGRHASRMDGGEEGIDLRVSPFQFEGPFDPGIS